MGTTTLKGRARSNIEVLRYEEEMSNGSILKWIALLSTKRAVNEAGHLYYQLQSGNQGNMRWRFQGNQRMLGWDTDPKAPNDLL